MIEIKDYQIRDVPLGNDMKPAIDTKQEEDNNRDIKNGLHKLTVQKIRQRFTFSTQ